MADHSTESRICSGVTTAPADPATQGGGEGRGQLVEATCGQRDRKFSAPYLSYTHLIAIQLTVLSV